MSPTVMCDVCSGTDISENNFCNDCGSVVCNTCGNNGPQGWDKPKMEDEGWVSYCQNCGNKVTAGHNMFPDYEERVEGAGN